MKNGSYSLPGEKLLALQIDAVKTRLEELIKTVNDQENIDKPRKESMIDAQKVRGYKDYTQMKYTTYLFTFIINGLKIKTFDWLIVSI
jgi:tetrahydromethanopterin S-methyltransferase subunit B